MKKVWYVLALYDGTFESLALFPDEETAHKHCAFLENYWKKDFDSGKITIHVDNRVVQSSRIPE